MAVRPGHWASFGSGTGRYGAQREGSAECSVAAAWRTRFDGPEMHDTSHRGSGVARRKVDATEVWGRRNTRDVTPRRFPDLSSGRIAPTSDPRFQRGG